MEPLNVLWIKWEQMKARAVSVYGSPFAATPGFFASLDDLIEMKAAAARTRHIARDVVISPTCLRSARRMFGWRPRRRTCR